MPATLDWHPERENVLVMTFTGRSTMEEALDITAQESLLIEQADHIIHTIIDLSENEGAPQNFLRNLPNLSRMSAVSHPNSGTKIVVGAEGIASSFLQIFSRAYRKLHMVPSFEKAYTILDDIS